MTNLEVLYSNRGSASWLCHIGRLPSIKFAAGCLLGKKFVTLQIIDKSLGNIMTQSEKQVLLDKRYLRMARIWAENSYCNRRQVGAILVKDQMIISDGFNGTPSGFENVCEDDDGLTKPYVLHAEANAISKVARSNNSSDGSTLYVTASPCMECSKLIIQSGIKRVVYNELYRITDGIDLLRRAGVECVHIADTE